MPQKPDFAPWIDRRVRHRQTGQTGRVISVSYRDGDPDHTVEWIPDRSEQPTSSPRGNLELLDGSYYPSPIEAPGGAEGAANLAEGVGELAAAVHARAEAATKGPRPAQVTPPGFLGAEAQHVLAVLKPTRDPDGVHGSSWPEPLSELVGVACLWKIVGEGELRIAQPATTRAKRFQSIIVHVDHLDLVPVTEPLRRSLLEFLGLLDPETGQRVPGSDFFVMGTPPPADLFRPIVANALGDDHDVDC